jgi:acetolactate synthase-1/2/3 large subunit
MAEPMCKGSFLVPDARRIPEYIARAMRLAFSGRRGPVHLTIPIDVQEQSVEENDVTLIAPDAYRPNAAVLGDPKQVRQAVALLRQAQRPLLIAGSAAGYTLSGAAMQRFIETTRLPIVTEEQSRGLVPDDHPYVFGYFERGLNRAAAKVRDADVVVLLGRKQDFIIGFCRPPHVAANAKIIQIDPSPLEIGRNRGVDVGMAGDVASILEQMADEAAKYEWKDLPWLDDLRAARAAQAEWAETLAQPKTPMHALFVHKTLKSILRPDDCLVFDGGDFCHFGRSYLPALTAKHWFNVSSLGMLGSSLPTALAAKVAYPNSRVFMLTGDGAFGFNGMEFDTAVRHGLNIVAIIGNDSAWGIDRQIQLGLYGRAVATDLCQSRYEQIVQGLGGYGEFVERPEHLKPALERALATNKPALLNVAVERAISPRAKQRRKNASREMRKSAMRPVPLGEILNEEFLKPLGLTANALALCRRNLRLWHSRNQKLRLRDRFPFRRKCGKNSASARARCWNGTRKATPWSCAKPAGIPRKTFIGRSLGGGRRLRRRWKSSMKACGVI